MPYRALVSLFSMGWLSSACEGENKIHNLNLTGKNSHEKNQVICFKHNTY